MFPFSAEPDTPAGRMRGQLSEETKQERVDALMVTQQDIAFEQAEQRVGSRFNVLIDEVFESGMAQGRHEGQAPSVDSVTYVEDCNCSPGEFVEVRGVDRDSYDLIATPTQVALPILDL